MGKTKKLILLLFVLMISIFTVEGVQTYVTNGSHIDQLEYSGIFLFVVNDQRHNAVVLKVTNESVKIRISPEMMDLTLIPSETREVDLDENGLNDFKIYLSTLTKYGGRFIFTILDEDDLPTGGMGGSSAPIEFCELTCREVYVDNYYTIFLDEYTNWRKVCEYELTNLTDWGWRYNEGKCYHQEPEVIVPDRIEPEPEPTGGGPLTCDTYTKESQCLESILGNCAWIDNKCIIEPEKSSRFIGVIIVVVIIIGIILYIKINKKKKEEDGEK